MAFSNIYIGENVQSFKTAPKLDRIDMVVLNIDEYNYVSSPAVIVDEEKWESSRIGKKNGTYTFVYDEESGTWKRSGSSVDIELYGITTIFNVDGVKEKAGDTITINRLGESKTTENPNPKIEITATLTRSGRTIETNCPLCKGSDRQSIADNLLESLSRYGYQPFTATGAEVNPLAELGDGITAHGVYGGIYQQELSFDALMNSSISAPADEELDREFTYKDKHERFFKRRYTEIASEFAIHADEIAARVTREGSGDGFSWSLIESGFSVKAGSKVIFRVDKDGTYVDGTGKFTGQIIGGSIKIGSNFSVDENGYMECHGAEFHGDIYAENGYFNGTVRAGSIDYGGNAGYLSGSGISSGSIYGDRLAANTVSTAYTSSGINKSLGYADFSNGVFNGWNTASTIYANSVVAKSSLYIPYGGGTRKVSVNTVTINGHVYNVLTI